MPNPPIVHYLHQGQTPCLMRWVPAGWPPGHKWSSRWDDVTCGPCMDTWRAQQPRTAVCDHPSPAVCAAEHPASDGPVEAILKHIAASVDARPDICAWCHERWPGHSFECPVYQRGGSGAIPPLSAGDARRVADGVILMSGILAGIAGGLPDFLVYLTDKEAARVTAIDGLALADIRAMVEGLLPLTKVATRLFKAEVAPSTSPEENPPPAAG